MKLRKQMLALLTALAAMVAVLLTGASSASAAPVNTAATQQAVSVPVTGTFTDATGALGTMTGTFTPTRFSNQNGQLVATGTLVATLTDSAGTVLGTTTQTVSAPAAVTATCQVLNLDLGAIHLNLLGLVVDLAPVHLAITAQQVPGALLGNLLCAVSHLLDGAGGGTGALSTLLNQILAIL